jgi:Rieske Fe-S protein
MLGLTSLAFVAGHGFIVVQSHMQSARGTLPKIEIAGADELAIGGAKVFDYPDAGDSCVLVRLNETQFVAYGQKCTHLSCPVIPQPEQGKFLCPCHKGSFDLHTGQPLAGPPRRPLPRVNIEIAEGRIFAVGIEMGVA